MMCVSFISYLDRHTLAVLAPTILRETHLTTEQYGWIIGAFSWAYMLGSPLWGMWLDQFGLRRGMTVAVGIWTTASTAHAFLTGAGSFALARGLLGFGEGATFPGGLRTAVETLPPAKRSRGMALAYSGGSLGAILTPLLITPVAMAYGWRGAFLVTGGVGALWLLAWIVLGPRLPVRQAQLVSAPGELVRPLFALAFGYGLCAIPLALILYASPIYLSRVLGLSQGELGRVLWVPPLGWEVGYFFWGWMFDRYPATMARPTGWMTALTLLSLPLAFATLLHSVAATLALFFFSMFIAAGFVVLTLRYGAAVVEQERLGLVAGVGAGSWSLIVALIMPGLGRLFDQSRYSLAFGIVAAIPVLGLAGWWLLSRDQENPPQPRSDKLGAAGSVHRAPPASSSIR